MKRADVALLLLVVCLTLFGLLMIYDASSYIAFRDFKDKYHYIKDQSIWVVLGLIGMTTFSYFDYHKLYNLAFPLLVIGIGFLLLVFVPGVGVSILGAHRWLNFHLFLFQPSEFIKLALAIYLAAWFSTKERSRFTAFLLLIGFIMLLIIGQPDMGTAIIILCEALIVYYLAGGNVLYLSSVIPILGVLGLILIKIEPYRAQRLATFLNPNQSISGSSYHVRQILIALGSGGLTGVGIGNSLEKYAYLPENTTDSIFAIIAEELGFVGAFILIFCFAFFALRGFIISMNAKDTFGKLLGGAITAFLTVQVFVNLGAQTALLPLTGVPLPFISYGGSALLIDLCAVGVLLNISRQTVHARVHK